MKRLSSLLRKGSTSKDSQDRNQPNHAFVAYDAYNPHAAEEPMFRTAVAEEPIFRTKPTGSSQRHIFSNPAEYQQKEPTRVTSPSHGHVQAQAPVTNPSAAPAANSLTMATENPLRALSRYDVVFLIDDSGSMVDLWVEARDALMGIVKASIEFDEDGLDVYFLNSNKIGENLTREKDVVTLFKEVYPGGSTPTAERIDFLLHPYVSEVEDARRNRKTLPKPKVLICITDGRPNSSLDVENSIVQLAKRLDDVKAPLYQLGLQFLQIGTNAKATEFLRKLDDDLKGKYKIRDMVDTVEYKGTLDAEFILQICLGSVNRRLDSQSHR